jgi:hypothetical protein
LALYKYRRYAIVGHILIGLAVCAFTIVTSVPLYFSINMATAKPLKRTHMLIGIAILIAIALQIISGAMSKLLDCCRTNSVVIYYMNKSHMVLGYLLTILCKFQNYYIMKRTTLWYVLFGIDILFFIMLIIRKLWFPKL